MKKKLQKYLSGEREGFSLVELIIVIAIMAILIGIVALAVIPYLEKSRVGKDQQTVDTVYSAFQATIADQKVSNSLDVDITATGGALGTNKGGLTVAEQGSFMTSMAAALNCADASAMKSLAEKLESKDAKAVKKITCTFDADTGEIKVEVTGTTIKSSNKA